MLNIRNYSNELNLIAFLRFIDSEANLDVAIKSLLPLSQVSTLSYPEIIRSGAMALLVGLLTHENMDIVIDVVELIYEFTDEDAELDQENEESERYHEVVNMLVNSFVSARFVRRYNHSLLSDRKFYIGTFG